MTYGTDSVNAHGRLVLVYLIPTYLNKIDITFFFLKNLD